MLTTLLLAATVLSGFTGGLCFAFSAFLMRSFDNLGAGQAIRVMQSLNGVILRSSAMAVWFAPVLLGGVALLWSESRAWVATSTAIYALGAVVITGTRNVPLNETLDRVDPDSQGAAEAWSDYRRRWGFWNALRTVTCALACAGFALAA